MRYFVTGATGFIGGKLVRRLIADGHEVSALVRDPSKAKWLEDLGVEVFQGDITEPETLIEPMEGADGLFHIAAWYKTGQRDSSKAERINVEGTRNILNAMKKMNINKGVYTSTLSVFSNTNGEMMKEDHLFRGKHLSEYDHTKWEAHYSVAKPMMLNQDLPLVIVMPGVVYGPGDTSATGKMIDEYLEEKLPLLPKGAEVCWAHIDDIIEAHILAMEKGEPGETYIIAGPRHSMIEAIDVAKDITGIKPPRMKASIGFLKFMSKVMGVVNIVFPLSGNFHPETLRVVAGVTYLGDNTKAKEELGYSPRTLKDGFSEYIPKRMEELGISK